MWTRRLASLTIVLGLFGCNESAAGPADMIALRLVGFTTPTEVSAADTLRISLAAVVGCGVVPAMDIQLQRGRVAVRAWAMRAEVERNCIAIYPATSRARAP